MKNTLAKPYTLTAGDVAESLWLTNAGTDDMTRRLKAMTGTPRDLAMLEYVIAAEKGNAKRPSRLKPMEAALKRLSKSAGTLALAGESKPPDWTRARFLLGRIKTAIRLSLAGQVLLGQELLTIKTELGFVGRGGDRRSKPHDAVLKSLNRTWEDWCKAELNRLSPDTADRFITCYEAAKLRVKKHGGDKKLLGLLETHPAKLTEKDDKLLAGMVDKLVDGDTQKSLLEELKIAKCHVPLTGGDTSQHQKKKPGTAEQLVFAMFVPLEETITKAARAAENLRLGPNYQHLLYSLPLVSSEPGKPSLTALEAQLEAVLKGDIAKALEEIRAVKAVRMNNPAAKAS